MKIIHKTLYIILLIYDLVHLHFEVRKHKHKTYIWHLVMCGRREWLRV
jgi:hypothetical protein